MIEPLTVVGVITILHGMAHLVPVAAELQEPTLATRRIGFDGSALVAPRVLMLSLFTVCALGFVLGGLAAADALVGADLWRPFTDGTAVLSAVALVLFPNAFPARFRYRVVGLVVDIVIIGNWLQIWDWPM